jgi:hypothetical protein
MRQLAASQGARSSMLQLVGRLLSDCAKGPLARGKPEHRQLCLGTSAVVGVHAAALSPAGCLPASIGS